MKAFTSVTGFVAPIMRANVDTDIIIPSREITSPGRDGYGEKLFAPWRYLPGGRVENPNFILNRKPYRDAKILLCGPNFGCGSSREMAVWALYQFGIRCVVAPSFGAIFHSNCVRNGLLPVELDEELIDAIAAKTACEPTTACVDLKTCVITLPGRSIEFSVPSRERTTLLLGLDPIGLTLLHHEKIRIFAEADRRDRPWIWNI
jgi:3-isopropylmalate/(R)-2-methylmalate dehydratase small subunit